MKFKDHFSGHAAEYARFRPHYPDELFEHLASISPRRELAWDCATGSGQGAVGLARHFEKVIATDASAQQIESAEPDKRISYRVAPAEASGVDSASVDLILVAQALHWFDLDRFFTEAKRVLKDDGVLAISSYKHLEIMPEIDAIIWKFYRETTGPFWPPERDLVETDYKNIQLPFSELPHRQFEMRTQWNLNQLLGYLRTWSATQRFIATRGFDPVDSVAEELGTVWKNPEEVREINGLCIYALAFRKCADGFNETAGNRVPSCSCSCSRFFEHEYEQDYEHEWKRKRRALRPAPPLSLSSFSLAIAL